MYHVLAVSGYKPHEIGVFNEKHEQLPFLKKAIKRKLSDLISEFGVEWITISGQAGVELWAAEACLLLQEEGVDIKLAVLAPFMEQEEKFPEKVKELYEKVWLESDFQDYITKRPYDSPAQLKLKNEFIVNKTQAMMLLYDESTEGTPKFYLEAAKKKQESTDYPIFYVTPDDIEDMIRAEQDWN
ncbi:DUF1273 family protein [Paenalkalicoccus suaedae]|uniref:DUF1273 family protein n=1 Tax=Paenalkalicoccus suaedae TaxID=2592382 RepID=A0A859FGH6_9BACI|nr:SLOG family protein [Paenalkalicoccus suaedae]QKS71305.1 DUF1273 family protein [Paenalkalicoccus suaedae]